MAGGAKADGPHALTDLCLRNGFGALCSYSRVLALLFLVFVVMVVVISLCLHYIEHWIDHHFDGVERQGLGVGLRGAMERIKEEFMITGIIALLLFAFGRSLESLTCTEHKKPVDYEKHLSPPYENGGSSGHDRRLLADDPTCVKATIPFIEQEYAHILLLLAALVNVIFSVCTIVITLKRISSWRKHEKNLKKSAELQPLSKVAVKSITHSSLHSLFKCLCVQFHIPYVWDSVSFDTFRAARYASMEFWRPLIFSQMLLKAQEQATVALQHKVQILLAPNVDGTNTSPLDSAVVDRLVHAAQRFRDELYFLSEAALEKQRMRRFEGLYRVRMKDFTYVPLLQLLASEQFAEDRVMAFLMPAIIGVCLLLPQDVRVFAWLPIVILIIMIIIGFQIQRILLGLKRRYHARYLVEYPNIIRRLRWRSVICRVIESKFGRRDKFTCHLEKLPELPAVLDEPKVKKRLAKRAKAKYTVERFDSEELFFLHAPRLMLRTFVFCYYCSGFFLAMVAFTAWIDVEEFVKRAPLMIFMSICSIATMLHGALNITPLFALITSSSSHTPAKFAEDLQDAQDRMRVDQHSADLALWLKESTLWFNGQSGSKVLKAMSTRELRTMLWDQSLRSKYSAGGDVEAQVRSVSMGRHTATISEGDVWTDRDRDSLISQDTARSDLLPPKH